MESALDMKSEYTEIDLNDTIGKTNCISSLQWELLDTFFWNFRFCSFYALGDKSS